MRNTEIWGNLIPHGIIPVGGLGPNLTPHVLCDVTDQGLQIIKDVLLQPDLKLGKGYTRGFEGVVGSLYLPRALLQTLLVHALLRDCTQVFVLERGFVVGVEPKDSREVVADFRAWNHFAIVKSYVKDANGQVVEVTS